MSDPEIEKLRLRIDRIDQHLLALLAERAEIAALIGERKHHRGHPIVDAPREAKLLEDRARIASELTLDPDIVREIWALIMAQARARQATVR
jgi:chorismate mutase